MDVTPELSLLFPLVEDSLYLHILETNAFTNSSLFFFRSLVQCNVKALLLTYSLQFETYQFQWEEGICDPKWISFYKLWPQKALRA